MFFEINLFSPNNLRQFMILYKISRFFWSGLLCFSSKSLYPESIATAMLTLPKNKRSTLMLIGLPHFLCLKIEILKCFKLVTSHLLLSKNEIHQLLPCIFKHQPWKAHQLSLLETFEWSPPVKLKIGNLQQLHLIVGNFKQSCWKLVYIIAPFKS